MSQSNEFREERQLRAEHMAIEGAIVSNRWSVIFSPAASFIYRGVDPAFWDMVSYFKHVKWWFPAEPWQSRHP